MSNLSGAQFAVKDWNPFLAASNALGTINAYENIHHKRALQMAAYNQTATQPSSEKPTTISKRTKPTPQNTGAPYPGYRVQGPITPATTGAPMPGTLKTKTSTHPITGEAVAPVPVKRKGAKPTAPGTRPKKK